MYHQQLLGDEYQRIRILGEGAFGKVFLYRKVKSKQKTFILDIIRAKKNNKILDQEEEQEEYYAMKKFESPQDHRHGLDYPTLRQLKYLLSLDHPHIIKGKGVLLSKKDLASLYLILDYMLQIHDTFNNLPQLWKDVTNRKIIAYHILLGLNYLHTNMIIHRDLKPQNVFINKKGIVVIADFGFCRQYGTPNKKMSTGVCTIEYRAPQILFGTAYYTQKSDIWSFGCILAYLFTKQHLFPSTRSSDQLQIQMLKKIFSLRGTPNDKNWPNFDKFPIFIKFQTKIQPKKIQSQYNLPEDVASIIQMCLQLDPQKRPSTGELLKLPYFQGLQNMSLDVSKYYETKLQSLLYS